MQRVHETEAQGHIYTSACTVAVLPEVDEVTDIEVPPRDLHIDTSRASGPAVSTSTRPIPPSVSPISERARGGARTQRSQHKNRSRAMAGAASAKQPTSLRLAFRAWLSEPGFPSAPVNPNTPSADTMRCPLPWRLPVCILANYGRLWPSGRSLVHLASSMTLRRRLSIELVLLSVCATGFLLVFPERPWGVDVGLGLLALGFIGLNAKFARRVVWSQFNPATAT